MSTITERKLEQSERIIANMFRYVYWVCLNKQTATEVVRSTLRQLPTQYLQGAHSNEQEKLEVLKFLQSEYKRNISTPKLSYRTIFTNFFERRNYISGTKQSVQSMRVKLQNISEIDRAIFVLIYLWEINLSQVAEILQIPKEQVMEGFDKTLETLQAVLPGN